MRALELDQLQASAQAYATSVQPGASFSYSDQHGRLGRIFNPTAFSNSSSLLSPAHPLYTDLTHVPVPVPPGTVPATARDAYMDSGSPYLLPGLSSSQELEDNHHRRLTQILRQGLPMRPLELSEDIIVLPQLSGDQQ